MSSFWLRIFTKVPPHPASGLRILTVPDGATERDWMTSAQRITASMRTGRNCGDCVYLSGGRGLPHVCMLVGKRTLRGLPACVEHERR